MSETEERGFCATLGEAFSRCREEKRRAGRASLEITVRPILLAVNESRPLRRRLFAVFARPGFVWKDGSDASRWTWLVGSTSTMTAPAKEDAARRYRGTNQLIWQIIASRCKQGGSICLAERKRGRRSRIKSSRVESNGGEGQPRVSVKLERLGGWISKGKTRDINPRRRHGLGLFLSPSQSPSSPGAYPIPQSTYSQFSAAKSSARIYRRRNQTYRSRRIFSRLLETTNIRDRARNHRISSLRRRHRTRSSLKDSLLRACFRRRSFKRERDRWTLDEIGGRWTGSMDRSVRSNWPRSVNRETSSR